MSNDELILGETLSLASEIDVLLYLDGRFDSITKVQNNVK